MEFLIILAFIVGILNGIQQMKLARSNPEKYGSKPTTRYWYFRNHGIGMGFRTGPSDD